MRVLMLGRTNSPHVEDLAVSLDERGVEVVVGGEPSPNLPPSRLTEHGIRVELAPPGALAAPGRMFRRVSWVRDLSREFRPDIVHGQSLVEDPFYAVLARARPLVATAWGSEVLLPSRIGKLRGRFVARRADLLTADSEVLLNALAAIGAKRSRLTLVNWGVDLDLFGPGRSEARRRLGLPDGPIVLSPRALKPLYNPEIVVEAFGRVLDAFPDALLVVKYYGDVPPGLTALPFRDRIRFVGHVPVEELADYYRAASVCVSIPSSDSAPRSVWEAMACGCPCVLSDLPWVHELIEDGRDALITAIDVERVAEAIGRVLGDERLAASIVEHGRSLVERHHDRSAEIDKLIAAYRTLIER